LLFFPLSLILGSTYVNIILTISSLLCIYYLFKEKSFCLIKEKWIFFFFIFILYNIFKSFFVLDKSLALQSSFSLFRFIFFSLFIVFCIQNIKNFEIIIKFWCFLIVLVCLDSLWQYLFFFDFFGFPKGGAGYLRLSGPFGRKLIVGAYLSYISVPLIFYFFSNWKIYKNNKKIILLLIYLLIFITIALTGERLGLLIFLFSSVFIFFFNMSFKNFLYILFLLCLFLLFLYLTNSTFNRRTYELYNTLLYFDKSSWWRLYQSGYLVFKSNYFFGVGLKNYSLACVQTISDPNPNSIYQFCSTHPHNFYLDILSETGIIGLFLLFLSLGNFFWFIKKKLTEIVDQKKFNEFKGLLYGNILIMLIYLWPIKTSGRFFTTWNGSFFWLNLGIALLITNNLIKKNLE
jgi:O-antigen ligase